MRDHSDYDDINSIKAEFNDIYDAQDPRLYFQTLGQLDYQIPQNARPIFEKVFHACRESRDLDTLTVLDIGCSYGINAALLKHDVNLDDLYTHYNDPATADLERSALIRSDAAILGEPSAKPPLEVIGLDIAGNAVAYAHDLGLLDDGIVADLEAGPLDAHDAERVADVDAIISTGCVGYVGEETFNRLLARADHRKPPWVASFVLRMFPYEQIARRLADFGLVTEKLEGRTFVQRAFESQDERDGTLQKLQDLGLSSRFEEKLGCFVTEFFLSRPADEVARHPLGKIAGMA